MEEQQNVVLDSNPASGTSVPGDIYSITTTVNRGESSTLEEPITKKNSGTPSKIEETEMIVSFESRAEASLQEHIQICPEVESESTHSADEIVHSVPAATETCDPGDFASTNPDGTLTVSHVGVSPSVMPVSILLTQQVGVVPEAVENVGEGVLITESFTHIPGEETHFDGVLHQDTKLSQIPATVHLQQDSVLEHVAVEIHIPMHTQLVVSDYMEENVEDEKGREVYFIEGKVNDIDPEEKQPDIVIHRKQESWTYEGKSEKDEEAKKIEVRGIRNASKVKKFCCEKCGKTFSKSSNFCRHKNVHLGKKFPCETCGKVYSYKETLRIHRIRFHREPLFGGLHKCKYCSRQYTSAMRLGVHLRSHPYEKPFRCSHCKKTFSTEVGLKKHKVVHTLLKPFQCDVCRRRFTRKPALLKHQIIHASDRSFKCSLCSKVFPDQYSHRSHKCVHYSDRPHGCQYCSKRFNSLSAVQTHEKIHTRPKIHACSSCEFSCGTLLELKRHSRSHWKVHEESSRYLEKNQCKDCGAKFTHSSTLRAHERTHSGEMPFVCSTCQKPFTYYSSWKRHLKIHKGEKVYQCVQCGKGFTKKLYLEHHRNSFCNAQNLPDQKPLRVKKKRKKKKKKRRKALEGNEAQIKSKESVVSGGNSSNGEAQQKSSVDINRGDQFELNEIPRYGSRTYRDVQSGKECQKFDRELTQDGQKNVQENEINVQENWTLELDQPALKIDLEPPPVHVKPFVCDICGKMYKSKPNLQRHLKVHEDNKPFICEHCGKGYSRKPILKEHLLMAHGEGPPQSLFNCTDCGQSFPSNRRLQVHRRKHTGERPFKCRFCPKTFKESSNVKRHEIIHSGLKPYVCVVCQRGFSDRGNLQKHELTHGIQGEEGRKNVKAWKPFSCDVCGKSFKQLGYLRYHMKMHEEAMPYSCILCDRKFSQAANLKVHLKSHTEKVMKCNKCHMTFREEAMLLSHQEKQHNTEKCFVCGTCDKVLSSKSSLQRHENKHLGLKPFKCAICPSSFSEKVMLKRHMSTHKDDENIFFCTSCETNFTSKDELDEHVANKSCSKTHNCDQCDKVFGTLMGLSRHQRSHYSIHGNKVKSKIYICDICGDTFERKKMLSAHKNDHKDFKKHK